MIEPTTLSLLFSVVLVALSVLVFSASLAEHMPWSVIWAIGGGTLEALALVVTALTPAGIHLGGAQIQLALLLRMMALFVLTAAAWQFLEHRLRRKTR